jgi:hypothetical protein
MRREGGVWLRYPPSVEVPQQAACILCGKRIDAEPVSLTTPAPLLAVARSYYAHPWCLKKVARPRFDGIDSLPSEPAD